MSFLHLRFAWAGAGGVICALLYAPLLMMSSLFRLLGICRRDFFSLKIKFRPRISVNSFGNHEKCAVLSCLESIAHVLVDDVRLLLLREGLVRQVLLESVPVAASIGHCPPPWSASSSFWVVLCLCLLQEYHELCPSGRWQSWLCAHLSQGLPRLGT